MAKHFNSSTSHTATCALLLTGGEHSTAGVSAAIAAFSLAVPIVVRLGAPFEDVSRSVLFADLCVRLGGAASWPSTHGMSLQSHKDAVAADFALAGILACTRSGASSGASGCCRCSRRAPSVRLAASTRFKRRWGAS